MNSINGSPLPGQRLLYGLFFGAMALAGCWVLFGLGVCMAGASLLLCLLCQRVRLRRFGPALFAAAFLARLAVILVLHPPVLSDFKTVYDASQDILAGDFSLQYANYFTTWPGQTGQAVFQALLLRLWNSPFFLKLVNCLAGAGTAVLVYKTARRFFSETAARAAGALYAFSLLPLTMCAVLSNHPASTLFTCLAVWLLTAPGPETPRPGLSRALLPYGLAGVCTALANVIRPDALVMLVAVAAFCLFLGLGRPFPRRLAFSGLGLGLFLLGYFLVFQGISLAISALGIQEQGLAGGNFTLKLVYGFSQERMGQYSGQANRLIQQLMAQGMTREAAQRTVLGQELHAGLGSLLKLLEDKERVFWLGNALSLPLIHLRETSPFLCHLAMQGESFCGVSAFVLGMLGFFHSRRPGSAQAESLLPALYVFASFSAYLFIEVQARYVYGAQAMLYILSAGGLEVLASLVRNWKSGGSPAPPEQTD